MSRPSKTKSTRLARQISFRLTEEEFAELAQVAERAGVRPGELARRLVRGRHGQIVIHTSRRHDPAFIAQIRRIGQNLNTLTKNAAIFKRVSPRVDTVAAEIQELLRSAITERSGT